MVTREISQELSKEEVGTVNPQDSLETILKLEIEVAERIANANDSANRRIEKAKKNLISLKNSIVEEARKERDQIIAKGIESAQNKAAQQISEANKNAEILIQDGKKYTDEAIGQVLNYVLSGGAVSK